MPAVSLSPVFNWQNFSIGGLPLSFGRIYTYQAGTSTPQATYTTSAGNVANANPIILGPDGRPPFEIWLVDGQAYNLVLKDALGNLVPPNFDNVVGVEAGGSLAAFILSLASSIGSTLVGFLQAGVGAVLRTVQAKLRERVSVEDFGAAMDGSDDTAALTKAEAALPSTGGTIWVGPGALGITGWTPSKSNVNLRGAGILATTIKGLAGAPTSVITISGTGFHDFSDFKIDGDGVKANCLALGPTGSAGAAFCTFTNIGYDGATTDTLVLGNATFNNDVSLCLYYNNDFRGSPSNSQVKSAGSNTALHTFIGGQMIGTVPQNVEMLGGSLTFEEPNWTGATGYDVVKTTGHLQIYGGHSESNAVLHTMSTDPQSDQSAVDCIDGFEGSTSGSQDVYHEAHRTLTIANSFFGGNVRVGASAILEGGPVRFGTTSGFVNDAGAINRIPRVGTYAPTVFGGTTVGTGQAYNRQLANWSRNGRVVTLFFDIILTAKGTGTGNLCVSFPTGFTADVVNLACGLAVINGNITYPAGTTQIISVVSPGQNAVLFYACGDSIAPALLNIATHATNTTQLTGSVTFLTNV